MHPRSPVIIAGAGPVGCVLGLLLARARVPVLIVEKAPDLQEDLRASTFHPSTLDLLDTLGLTPALIERGLLAPTYQYRDRRSGARAVFDLGVLAGETAHPYRVQCEQYKLTRLACAALAEYPEAQVRFGCRVESFVQGEGGVLVELAGTRGRERVRGSFLIGCDGAHSVVRRHAGIEFEGITYPEKFLVLSTDAPLDELLPGLSAVNYVADADEWCTILRTRDLWRVLFPADGALTDEQLVSDDAVEARLQRLAPLPHRYTVEHRTLYRVHQRVARTFRDGRVLLAGDAAHVNNPLGGMGMNGGIHDAFVLGRALVAAWHDGCSMAALERYARTRRHIAAQFINEATARNKRVMEERDPAARQAHLEAMQSIASDPVRAHGYLMRSAMIDAWRASEAALAADQPAA